MDVSTQAWAARLPLTSSKIRAEAVANRLDWLDALGRPVLPADQKEVVSAEQLEVSSCSDELKQSDEAFALGFQQGWLQPSKEATAAALLLHPADRNL